MPRDGKVHLRRLVFDTQSYRSPEDATGMLQDAQRAMEDALRLQKFYQTGPRDRLMVPETWDILRQMQGEKVLVYELDTRSGPEIIGASILLDYELPVLDENNCMKIQRFLRVGMQYCMLNGFNIQQLMNSITLLDTVIHDPVGLYFGGIVTGNADSLNNVLPMKYIPWPQANVPQTLDCEVRHHARTETTGKNVHYFRAGFEALDLATECVLNWADNPVRVRRAKPPKPSQSTGASRPDPFSDVAQIELVMEPGLFAPVAHYARRIANAQPKTLSDLKVALENDLISDEFFVLNDNSKVAVTVQKLGCVQALRRLFGELTRRL